METGYIHKIESMGLVDGPGVRTVIFLQGCLLRCQYCHNPDTWSRQGGTEMTVEEVMAKIRRFRPYYGKKGGVTCSGGEPLLQADFVKELFRACKAEGISTCLDTAGVSDGNWESVLDYTDLVIFDIKQVEEASYRRLTGRPMADSIAFLERVQQREIPLWIRHVVVPGWTDSQAETEKLANVISALSQVQKVELLPYHTMGMEKYEQMGIRYPLAGVAPMEKEKTAQLEQHLLHCMKQEYNKIMSEERGTMQ